MMRPFITMQGQAKDALEFYQAVFPSFEMISLQHHSEPHENLIMLAVVSIDEQEIMISDSFITHDWQINPGISFFINLDQEEDCLLYTSPSPRDGLLSRMPSSA